jgi:protein-S-isoprenylcysteine O-methyltransferase Ste14
MVEMDEDNNVGRFNVDSKFLRVLLVLLTVLLIFVGPTYIPFVLADLLHVNYVASVGTGVVLFIAGLLLMWFLVRKKIIT